MKPSIYITERKEEMEFKDERGSIYTLPRMNSSGIQWKNFKISRSHKNVFRGFHGDLVTNKLVSCLNGELILFVKSFTEMSGEMICYHLLPNNAHIFIPKGYINGHYTLKDDTIFSYYIDQEYDITKQITVSPYSFEESKRVINDSTIMSERDKNGALWT
jgi:dTDP-4-dehydrorhamnose 3,5-epimerase